MLAQTIFLVAAIAIFALSAMAGVAGYARAQTADVAKAALAPAIEQAVAQYQQTVATTIAAAAPSPPAGGYDEAPAILAALNGGAVWPEQTPVPYQPNPAAPLYVAVDVAPATVTAPVCSAPSNAGPDVENDAQCSPFVQESRLALTVTADAGPLDASGAVAAVAHERFTVTLRLFALPPYAMIAGAKDGALATEPHEGDSGGYGNALGDFGPPPAADDTTIHVQYACTPGSGACTASQPPPADLPTSLPWTNANGQP